MFADYTDEEVEDAVMAVLSNWESGFWPQPGKIIEKIEAKRLFRRENGEDQKALQPGHVYGNEGWVKEDPARRRHWARKAIAVAEAAIEERHSHGK